MALTAAEQAELDRLEKEVGDKVPPSPTSRLSPAEQDELNKLEGEVGHLVPSKVGPPLSEMKFEPDTRQAIQTNTRPGTYDPSVTESAILGAGNVTGLEKRLAPVSAALEKGVGTVTDLFRPKGEELYSDSSIPQLAEQTRGMLQSVNENHPIPAALGQGIATSALLAPFGAAAAGPLVQGGVGAAQEYAESGSLPRAAGAGVLSAATAGILSKFLPASGKVLSKSATIADDLATESAKKALGFSRKLIKDAGGPDKIKDIVSTLREAGLFKNGISKEAMGQTIDELATDAGKTIDTIYGSTIGNIKAGTTEEITTSLKNSLQHAAERVKSIAPEKLNQLDAVYAMIKGASPTGELNLRQLWQLTKDLGNIAWEKGVLNENRQVYQDAWKILKDTTQKALKEQGTIVTDKAFEVLTKANNLYNAALQGGKALADSAMKAPSVAGTLIKHGIASGVGAMFGGAPGAVIAPAALAATEAYGPQIASKTFSAASKPLFNAGSAELTQIAPKMGKFAKPLLDSISRGSGAVSHYILSQSSEEYRKKFKDITEGNK